MLKLSHLTKVYREKGESVRALDDVTLSFPEKGMVFVLGKSGCGKSTLLNLTGGLDSPTSGEIFINGRSSGDFSPTDYDGYRNSCVGFIFQEYNLLDEFTVGQNVSLALQLQGVKDLRSAVENALRRVGLEGFADRKPNTLSGGQKQRVAIARALVKDPQIVLADEPTGALDSETGGEILATLKELSEDKLVVVVTHDREFAEEYGDRIIELKDGKVISDTEKAAPAAEEGKGGFKQVPSRLPMARAIRMGAASLRVKPFRLVLTVLLSFVSFVLFGWASTMMLYNRRSVLVNSYYESGNPYVRLEKSYTFRSTDLLTNETQEKSVEGAPMGNREIAALEEGAVGIYGVKSTSVSNLIVSGDYYDPAVRYLSVLPEGHPLREQFLEGRCPAAEDEIAVSSYFLECAKAGTLYPVDEAGVMQQTPLGITSAKDLVGKRLNFLGGTLTITGVFDSGEIPSRYDPLKDAAQGEEHESLKKHFVSFLEGSLHQLAFVTRDFYLRNREAVTSGSSFRPELDSYFDRAHDSYDFLNLSGEMAFAGIYFRVYKETPAEPQLPVTFLRGYEGLKELTGNQFIIGSNALQNYLRPLQANPEVKDLLDATAVLDSYVQFPYDAPSEEQLTQAHELLLAYFEEHPISVTIEQSKSDGSTTSLGFGEIVGFYDSCRLPGGVASRYNGIYCSESFYESLDILAVVRTETNYVPDPEADFQAPLVPFSSRSELEELAKKSDPDSATDVFYEFGGSIATSVGSISYYIEIMWQVFLWVGLVLAIFAVLLLFNFITLSISNKQKEIGILRAIGARGTDIFKIFFAESGIIVGSCTLLALIGAAVLSAVINSVLKSLFDLEVTLFVFGWPSALLMVGIAVVVAIVSTFLPVYYAAKRKPVDIIRAL